MDEAVLRIRENPPAEETTHTFSDPVPGQSMWLMEDSGTYFEPRTSLCVTFTLLTFRFRKKVLRAGASTG
jgi:hypothetical protein